MLSPLTQLAYVVTAFVGQLPQSLYLLPPLLTCSSWAAMASARRGWLHYAIKINKYKLANITAMNLTEHHQEEQQHCQVQGLSDKKHRCFSCLICKSWCGRAVSFFFCFDQMS